MTPEEVRGLKEGDVVRWTSQAGGHEVTKEGPVVCYLSAGEDALSLAKKRTPGLPINRLKCDRVSEADRVLVQVLKPSKRNAAPLVTYYGPPVTRLVAHGELVRTASQPPGDAAP